MSVSEMIIMSRITNICTIFALFCSIAILGDYVPKWSCDFENEFCDWYRVEESEAYWEISNGYDYYNIKDHTKNSSSGHFLTLPASREGRLMSPIIQPNNGSCKMIFYYRRIAWHNPFDVMFLKIKKVTKMSHNIFREVLFESIYLPFSWKKAEINLTSNIEFQLEISGIYRAYGKPIAIDDIMFTDGCFTNERTPIKIVKAQSSSVYNFPNGVFYEQVNNSWNMVCSREKADAACKLLGLNGVASKGTETGSLDSGQTICLPNNYSLPNTAGCYNQTNCVNATYWRCKQDHLPTCPSLTHKPCTSSSGCFSYNQICDYHKDCPGGEDETDCSAYNRCDFQNGFCNWVASKQAIFEWQRYRDSSTSRYYLRMDTRHASYKKGIAILRLKNPIQGKENSQCTLRFAYRFNTIVDGGIMVRLTSNKTNRIVWRDDAMFKDRDWYRQFVELKLNDVYQLDIEAESDGRQYGPIDLANVSFARDCSFINYTTHLPSNSSDIFVCHHEGKRISRRKKCDFNPDCFDGSDELNCTYGSESCTFDESLCNWKISDDAPVKPTRRRGKTPSGSTGPSKDHTNKFVHGYYVYLEATDRKMGEYGYLISNWMQRPVSEKCTFRWFYHMYNEYHFGVGELSVHYYDPVKRIQKKLWQLRGNQGSSWKYGTVTFDVVSFHYQLIMRFERGYSHRSDIAVDDVSFSEECYKTQNYTHIFVRQVCHTNNKKFYSTNKHSASVFFSSRNYYTRNINCKWYITTDSRLRISLTADYIITDWNDTVSIEAGSKLGTNIGGKYSGRVAPFYLTSSTNSMVITFHGTHVKAYQGFLFNFSSTDAQAAPATSYNNPSGHSYIKLTKDCNGRITTYSAAGSMTVTTGYYSYIDCIYKFYANNGYRMKFDFRKISTTLYSTFVEFLNNELDGPSKFYQNYGPFYFISKRSWLAFRLKTRHRYGGSALKLVVTATVDLPKGLQHDHLYTRRPSIRPRTTYPHHQVTTVYSSAPNARRDHSKNNQITVAWSLTAAIITVIIVVAIKYILWRKQRQTNRGQNSGGIDQAGGDIAVQYVPSSYSDDAPPPYSDAMKPGIVFINTANGAAWSCPSMPPPSFEDATNRANRSLDVLPTYDSIDHNMPQRVELEGATGIDQRNTFLNGQKSGEILTVDLPGVEETSVRRDFSRPASAGLTRSRPPSACSISDSPTCPRRPLIRGSAREHRNPAGILPPLQMRVRPVNNSSDEE